MKTPPETENVLARLNDTPLPPGELELLQRGEARAVQRMLQVMAEAEPTPRPRPSWVFPLAAAALVTLAAGWAFWGARSAEPSPNASRALSTRPPAALAIRGTASIHLPDGSERRLANESFTAKPEEELEVGEAGARVTAASGLTLTFAPGSRAQLADAQRSTAASVSLLSGKVTCVVPPQRAGSYFSVLTRDARVVVHGTTFTVEVGASSKEPSTCVRVSEGVVSVHSGANAVELRAGSELGCVAPPPSVTSPPAVPAAPPRNHKPPSISHPKAEAPATGSELGEQNRLLQAALAAEHRGEPDQAEASLHALIERYPSSPLVGEARRVLLRLRSAPQR